MQHFLDPLACSFWLLAKAESHERQRAELADYANKAAACIA